MCGASCHEVSDARVMAPPIVHLHTPREETDAIPFDNRVVRGPVVTSVQYATLKSALDAVVGNLVAGRPLRLVGDTPLSAWVYLGATLCRRGADVMVGPTSTPTSPVTTFHPRQASGQETHGFLWDKVPVPGGGGGGGGSGLVLFVSCFHPPTQEQLTALATAANAKVVVTVTLQPPMASTDDTAVQRWCDGVQRCVLNGLNGLDFTPETCHVLVAGPVQLAYAVGRALPLAVVGRRPRAVVAYDLNNVDKTVVPGFTKEALDV